MKTFAEIEVTGEKIRRYKTQRLQFEKFTKIAGGYLHYDGYTATNLDKEDAGAVRYLLMNRQFTYCMKLLAELEDEEIDVVEERLFLQCTLTSEDER